MFFRTLRNFITTLASLSLALAVGFGLYASNVCKLDGLEGERVFYRDSASSQGLRKEELSLRDFTRIKGVSVRFEVYGETAEGIVARITEAYGAEVLFTEEACGVTSYYCYTPKWTNGIEISGETVNLHVAVSETECAVGTPIIFDGF